MKTILRQLVLLTGYCLAVGLVSAQPVQELNENFFKLNSTLTGNKRYKAKNFIHLQPGVRYTPGSQGKLGLQVVPGNSGNTTTANSPTSTFSRQLDYNTVVGSLPGSWEIAENGAFNYSVPIPTPGGTAGMQPSLALSYQSSTTNGVVGVGWGISGLSAIQRTFQTRIPHGKISGINFDNTDAYALDGSNLVVKNTTVQTGVTYYRTEYESYRDITYYGATDAGSYFIVKATDGSSWEYGNSEDSKLFGPNGKIYQWKLSRVTDKFGNYMEYHYATKFGTEGCLDYVAYTGNASESLLPYNRIRFNYTGRFDQNVSYRMTKESVLSALLSSVDIISDGHPINTLKLDYLSNDLYSRLERVTLNDSTGRQMSPTVFGWEAERSAARNLLEAPKSFRPYFPDAASESQATDNNPNLVYGDFDGDGRSEPISFKNPAQDEQFNANFYLTRGDTLLRKDTIVGRVKNYYSQSGERQLLRPFKRALGAFDTNGDGKDELFLEVTNATGLTEELSSGVVQLYYDEQLDSLQIVNQFPFRPGFIGTNRNDFGVADIDGDGYQDLCGFTLIPTGENAHTAKVVLKLASRMSVIGPFSFTDVVRMETGDIDGDGVDEIWAIRRNKVALLKLAVSELTGMPDLQKVREFDLPSVVLDPTILSVADFNGDGNSDLLYYGNTTGWKFLYSDGYTLLTAFNWLPQGINTNPTPSGLTPNSTYYFRDFNRDGKTDIMEVSWATGGSTTKLFTTRGMSGENRYELREMNSGSYYSGTPIPLAFADVDGDGVIEACFKGGGGMISQVSIVSTPWSNTLTDISNGFGQHWKVGYAYLNQMEDAGRYAADKSYPMIFAINLFRTIRPLNKSIRVVSSVSETSDQGFSERMTMNYSGGQFGNKRKQFLGFSTIGSYNITTGMSKTRGFSFDHDTETKLPEYEYTRMFSSNFPRIDSTDFNYRITSPYPSGLLLVNDRTYSENFVSDMTTINNTYLNAFGLMDSSSTTVYAGPSEFVTTVESKTYTTANNWCACDVSSETVHTQRRDKPPYTTKSTHLCDLQGFRYQTDVDPDKARTIRLTLTKGKYGLPVYTTGDYRNDEPMEKDSTVYDAKGRNVIRTWNQHNQTSEFEYSAALNLPVLVKDINGNVSRFSYDTFGRPKTVSDRNGVTTEYSRKWSYYHDGFPDQHIYAESQFTPGAADTVRCLDSKGRMVLEEIDLFGNQTVKQQYGYNGKNELEHRYHFTSNADKTGTFYEYDELGRLYYETFSGSGKEVQHNYNKLKTIVTNVSSPTGQMIVTDFSPLNEVEQTENADGTLIQFIRNSKGDVIETVSQSKSVTNRYDEQGLLLSTNNPDIGVDSVLMNLKGQPRYWDNKQGNFLFAGFDALGRLDSTQSPIGKTRYKYDGSLNKTKGLLTNIEGPTGHRQEYTYDELQRMTGYTETINDKAYTSAYTYNARNQVTSRTYPSGIEVRYSYNAQGTMDGVFVGSNQVYQLTGMDKFGNLTKWVTGNAFSTEKVYNASNGHLQTVLTRHTASGKIIQDAEYDFEESTDNLMQRKRKTQGNVFKEDFEYDPNDRLRKAVTNPGDGSNAVTETVSYSGGQMTAKTHTGTYEYDAQRVNAVSAISDYPPEFAAHRQRITYNIFFKPDSVMEEDGDTLVYTYGNPQERISSTYRNRSTNQYKHKLYLGDYEIETDGQGRKRELHYISGPSGIIGVYVRSQGRDTMYYVFTDHLGSWNTVAREDGAVVQEQYYQPWGLHTNAAGTVDTLRPLFCDRGFTGHEHLDAFGLINMNGRMYDPVLGKMLSPDRSLKDPLTTDNHNSYAYALNNPLKYTDPTGWDWYKFGNSYQFFADKHDATHMVGADTWERTDAGLKQNPDGHDLYLFENGNKIHFETLKDVEIVAARSPGSPAAGVGAASESSTKSNKRPYNLPGGEYLPSEIQTSSGNVKLTFTSTSSDKHSSLNRISSTAVRGFIEGVQRANDNGAKIKRLTISATSNGLHDLKNKPYPNWSRSNSMHYIRAGAGAIDVDDFNGINPNVWPNIGVYLNAMRQTPNIYEIYGPDYNWRRDRKVGNQAHYTWVHTSFK
ncbi:MAG: SpvB/TcaC N-terminal domain-containing protein [Bacteroidota bacterium]